MKKIIQYYYQEDGETKVTNFPPFNPDFLSHSVRYKLRADKGFMLLNKLTGYKVKSCIISPDEMDLWEEISYEHTDDNH
jgi:hypothetical protein